MIKNYTSTVPVSRSIQRIEDRLVQHGAQKIMKSYDATKKLEGFCFSLYVQGREIPFKLPARVQNVSKVLRGEIKRPKRGTLERIEEQAARTAWKLISDWLDIQISLIDIGQVEIMEVLLPYVWNPATQETYFETIKGGGYKLLSAPAEGDVS